MNTDPLTNLTTLVETDPRLSTVDRRLVLGLIREVREGAGA